ncbi:hypothetical protein [Halorubrum sp. BV1]|uniref:hypothetical protein n=1 Tax=Halorubrum sp. BV1 TaxID=1498500 RepID=UPI000678B924|nr:hypothetical protein [Halorubrum sp. BV1]
MADAIPDDCAYCGESLNGEWTTFGLPAKWRLYLQRERDMKAFEMAPHVVCCAECRMELGTLKDAESKLSASGSESGSEEFQAELRGELDKIDLDGIVDEQHI